MKEIRTVRSDSTPGISRLKKEPKIAAKKLNAVCDSVSGKSSIESGSFSELSELSPSGEIVKPMPDPAFSASTITSQSQLTQSSDVIKTENQEPVPFSSTHGGFNGVGDSKIRSLEAQLVVSFLRKATAEALSLSEADPQSKKLLHALLEMVIEMHQTVPEERDRIEELLAAKTRIVFVCVLLFVLATVMTLFFTSRPRHSFGKPPPT